MAASSASVRIVHAAVTVLDGGMGSTLEDEGLDVRNPLWGSAALLTAQGRALNDRVHREFAAAGAQLAIANTHNASLGAADAFLRQRGLSALDPFLAAELSAAPPSERAFELMRWVNREAVESARSAAPGAMIAACLASPDRPYAEAPSLTAEEVESRLLPQLEVLEGIGPDLLFFEMLTTRSDLEGVARLMERGIRRPVGIGLVAGADGATLGGASMEEAVDRLLPGSPLVLFIQCTRYLLVDRALERLAEAVDGRALLGVYANDGRTWSGQHWSGERVPPEIYAEHAARWRAAGARVIGGCCGTGPAHVAALAQRLGRPGA